MGVFQVKSWFSGKVIFEAEAESIKEVVEAAVRSKSDLSCAYLRGADLSGADLHGANLHGADLRSANLSGVDLSSTDLILADLSRTDLSGADLRNADLSRAEMIGAYLRGANLRGARLNWNSHELLSAVLFQEAGSNIQRIKVAGAILCLRDWCWDKFLKMRSEPQFSWAMDTLAGYVVDVDEAPEALVNWKNRSKRLLEREV